MKLVVSIIMFVFVLCSYSSFSQNENKHWIFLTKNKLLTTLIFEDTVKKFISYFEKINPSKNTGFSSISDKKTGELLFYTIEDSVFTHLYTPMDNINYASTGSFGHLHSHSNLIVPFPTEHINFASKKYYLFHRFYYGIQNRFSYSIVDMSDGLGTIIAKNIPLRDSIIGSVTGTIDCSTGNYWVIVPDGNHRRFYSYRITKNGIDSMPIISDFNERIRTSNSRGNVQAIGYCKISPDGTKLIAFTSNVNNNSKYQSIYLYDFDKKTGSISNGRELLKQRINPYDRETVCSFHPTAKFSMLNHPGCHSINTIFQMIK